MKMRSFVFAAAAAVAAGATARAEVSARVWMLDHANPNNDELAELKSENPDAYALVKALLTKRSLGLLDPKHPTASFSKPAPEEENRPVGAAVYAKFATTDKERQALAGAEPAYDTSTVEDEIVTPAPSSGSHDWLNWKPADSAASDDAMVQNVLGSVAGLVGKKVPAPSAPKVSAGALDADEASILSADDAPAPKAEAKPVVQEPAPAQNNFLAKAPDAPAPKQTNSYLDGLDLTVDTKPDTPAPAQPVVAETPAAPVAALAATNTLNQGKSALDSFSFSDSDDQTTTTAAPKVQTPAPKSSALGSWLGMVQPHVQKSAAPVTTAAPADANPYLTDLQ